MIKKLVVIFLMSCLALQVSAQNDTVKKSAMLTFHVFYNDFNTAQQIRTTSFSQAQWSSISSMQAGTGFNYLKGITRYVDVISTLDGSFMDYLYKDGTTNGRSSFLLDANAGFNVKPLTDNHPVVPYIFAGLGASTYNGKVGLYIPVGVGLQFNFFNEAFVFTNMQYRKAVTSAVNDHLQYSIGIGAGLHKRKKVKPIEPVAIAAQPVKIAAVVVAPVEIEPPVKNISITITDEQTGLPLPAVDVILDGQNGNQHGLTNANGQFTFNAISAADYKISGTLNAINTTVQQILKAGFDIPGDNINIKLTHNDPRFTLTGWVNNKTTGKPEPDVTVNLVNATQGNSVNVQNQVTDGTFNIPLAAGSDFMISGRKAGYISNIERLTTKGLNRSATLYVKLELDIEEALPNKTITLKNIYYDSGSTQIKASASSDLEKLVTFLNDNPALRIEISSYTDSRGSDAVNLKLSKLRAQEVVNYLQKKGINKDRLVPKGYGETKLVNGCKNGIKCTPAQHEQNRRTEFKVISN